MRIAIAILFSMALSACNSDLGSMEVDVDSDEMNGLYDDEGGLDPGDLPAGEEWTQGPKEQAVGFYARAGRLLNAEQMPASGLGFVLANKNSLQNYGTYDLMAVVSVAAAHVQRRFPIADPLRVGPMSNFKGGKAPGHGSHQNGLDADIGYFRLSGRRPQAGRIYREGMGASLVRNGIVGSDFDYERNYEFIKYLVSSGRVSRIFVSSPIKLGFCRQAKKLGENLKVNEVLRVLRPYPGHGDHMHVRVTCPQHSPRCRNQPPPLPITGC